MRRIIAPALALSIFAATRNAVAIVGGVPDPADPAVVRIPDANCTGTLVAPRVILTAAHCQVPVGAGIVFSDGTQIDALAFHSHPSFDPTSLANDIAVVVLSTPSAVTPVPIYAGAVSDALVGRQVRIVGFGLSVGPGGADAGDVAPKRTGFTTISAWLTTSLLDDARPQATCAGDSGGPALLDVNGVEQIAGIASRGDVACTTFGVKTRTDVYLTSFLGPEIRATQSRAVPVGGACDFDEACASGSCVQAPDAPSVHYCASSCATDRDCPSSMKCVSDRCDYPLPSPGAVGSRCERDGDCDGSFCVEQTFGAARACSVECNPGAVGACSANYSCMPAYGRGGASACFPNSQQAPAGVTGGSCAAQPGRTPEDLSLCIVGACFMLVAHRRCRLDRSGGRQRRCASFKP